VQRLRRHANAVLCRLLAAGAVAQLVRAADS
jgi:hypothetical protein